MSTGRGKELIILRRNLSLAYYHYCLNLFIHKHLEGEIYRKHSFIWNNLLLALEQSYLLGLAKFFDRPRELDGTISIYYFSDFDQNKRVSKLKKVRNKLIAHLDRKLATQIGLLDELKMTPVDVDSLFMAAFSAVERIILEDEEKEVWKLEFELQRAEAEHWCKNWLSVFK